MPQHGTAVDGTTYVISGGGDEWVATVTPPRGKATVLAEKTSHTRAYTAGVKHHAEAVTK